MCRTREENAADLAFEESHQQKRDAREVIRQLENISRAIMALEGLPVDFRLARKLCDIQADICFLKSS